MLTIIKYEFRKNRTSLLVMLLVAAGLFLLAPFGKALGKESLLALSMIFLFLYALAAFFYALTRGISAYSSELRGRTGYLLMMVPRSTMSILFGKLLFSLAFAALMLAVTALALGASATMAFAEMVEQTQQIEGFLNLIRYGLAQIGLSPAQLAATALCAAVEILGSILVIVGFSYLSVTLSATLLREGKLRGLVSALFFLALFALLAWLENRILPEVELYASYEEALLASLPASLLHIILTCACTAASAVLLQKKVSL